MEPFESHDDDMTLEGHAQVAAEAAFPKVEIRLSTLQRMWGAGHHMQAKTSLLKTSMISKYIA